MASPHRVTVKGNPMISRHKGYYLYTVNYPGNRGEQSPLTFDEWTSDKGRAKELAQLKADEAGYPVSYWWPDLLEGKLSKVGTVKPRKVNPAKFDRCVKAVSSRGRGKVNAYAVCTAAGTRDNPLPPKSQVGKLSEMLKGTHVMEPENGLKAYHAAKDSIDAGRMKDDYLRVTKIKGVLKNFHVIVSPGPNGSARVYRPDTQQEIFVGGVKLKANPQSSSMDFYESFHGEPSKEVVEVKEQEHYHGDLGGVGVLVQLKLVTTTGYDVTLNFASPESLTSSSNPGLLSWLKAKTHKTTIYHVPRESGRLRSKSTHKGFSIMEDQEGLYRVPQLDRESAFESVAEAKKFIGHWAKQNPGPFREAGKLLAKGQGMMMAPISAAGETFGQVGGYLDGRIGRALNPSKVRIIHAYSPRLGVYGGKVYLIDENSETINGIPLKVQGTYGDHEVGYSDMLEWDRAYEGRVGDTKIITVPWAGGRKEFAVYNTDRYQKLEDKEQPKPKLVKPVKAETYRGFFIAKDSHGFLASDEQRNLVRGEETFTGSTKKSIHKRVDNWLELQEEIKKGRNPRAGNPSLNPTLLTSNESGTQLYLTGGDQSVTLDKIHMGDSDGVPQKDSMVLGEAYFVSYFTQKSFDKYEPIIYEHSFCEVTDKKQKLVGQGSGLYPTVRYDTLNKKLFLDGGIYKIDLPAVGVSPGIED